MWCIIYWTHYVMEDTTKFHTTRDEWSTTAAMVEDKAERFGTGEVGEKLFIKGRNDAEMAATGHVKVATREDPKASTISVFF